MPIKGSFVPTTQTLDVSDLYQADVSSQKFKELIVRLYQQFNLMAIQLNTKSSGEHNTNEVASGETFFANPNTSSATGGSLSSRPVFKKTFNFGALPNTTTKSLAHGLPLNSGCTLVSLVGAATNTAGTSYIPLPYASPTLINNIELYADATNIYVVTGKNQTGYTTCYITLKYLKN